MTMTMNEILQEVRDNFTPSDIEQLTHALDDIWREKESKIVSEDVDRKARLIKKA